MAAIWATASNLPLEKMAASSPDMSARQLAWAHEHLLSEENFQAAADLLNGLQHQMPLTSHWGNGTKAAFDGQFVYVGRKRLGYSSAATILFTQPLTALALPIRQPALIIPCRFRNRLWVPHRSFVVHLVDRYDAVLRVNRSSRVSGPSGARASAAQSITLGRSLGYPVRGVCSFLADKL